ncbi:hypothetical protein V5O48_007565 [Marasmius crinis-equi]|uniref:RNA helicase n=1 Tax=Marasmius crinis-equi TaxID=585013 RepID=A0ABR3FGB1_9AGAR
MASTGQCSSRNCRYSHDFHVCDPCGRLFSSLDALKGHLGSKTHKANCKTTTSNWSHCRICEINTSGSSQWRSHVRSSLHIRQARAKELDANIEPLIPESLPNHHFCGECNIHVQDRSWDAHRSGKRHADKVASAAYLTRLEAEESRATQGGIVLKGIFEFGVLPLKRAKKGFTETIVIQTQKPIKLVDFYLTSKTKGYSPSFTVVKCQKDQKDVTRKKPLQLSMTVRQQHIGRCQDRIIFIFIDAEGKTFLISHSLTLIVGDPDDHAVLKTEAPYVRPPPASKRHPERKVVPGVAPPKSGAIPWKVKLPESNIPEAVAVILGNDTEPFRTVLQQVQSNFVPQGLNYTTYSMFFKHLLWIEEIKLHRDMEQFDLHSASITREGNLDYLVVPGLAENRPSVMVGDMIRAHKHGSEEGKWFEGGVHVVRLEDVGIRFHSSFRKTASNSDRFLVRFRFNRYPLRRQHQALNMKFPLNHILFPIPERDGRPEVPSFEGLAFINPNIANNERQVQAVASILYRPRGSVPFIIFGPPGTGKTSTMVESILQVLQKNPTSRILVCTPSNSSADLIITRLRDSLDTNQLFRLNAPSRRKNTVPADVLPYTYTLPDPNNQKHFSIPPPGLEKMKLFRVVVSTCVSAAIVFGIGVPAGHYSHIFIDEAGQATEPEVMVPIRTIATKETSIVLSGDPKQLGPIIKSGIAKELGLGMSYLQRLMNSEGYDEVQGYGSTVVKLVKNFRSHPAILQYPNEQFYRGDLVPCGSPEIINYYIGTKHVVSPKFPIVYHSVAGHDERERSSPSFFNIDEATIVKTVVADLLRDTSKRISGVRLLTSFGNVLNTSLAASDIGVITPYRAQVRKIRLLLQQSASQVKVGSVEEFQGQASFSSFIERKAIIVSCVRSSQDFINFDLKRTLGFVANPERFNVAVTRAQALLVVVGDPSVLGLDPLWRKFLNYVHTNGGWTGLPIPWDPSEPVDEQGGYDRAAREQAQGEVAEVLQELLGDDDDDVLLPRGDTA